MTTVGGQTAPYRRARLGSLDATVERRDAGTTVVRCVQPLGPYPRRATDRLVHWATAAPDRDVLAWRGRNGVVERLTYADAHRTVRALGQALLDRSLSVERPLVILSPNSAEHALLTLAAMHVGVPVVPISPAYSLVSRDFALLRTTLSTVSPGLVFADDGPRFERAVTAAVPPGVELVVSHEPPASRRATPFAELVAAPPMAAVDIAHEAVGPDTIAKILFTSGSTGTPKGVINTHRMLTSNQQMIAQALPLLTEEPPVLVDWLPWHHTFGGNHNFGLIVHNGGTLFIDEGRPLPGAFEATVRNLREVAPTVYLSVPRGFEELVAALRRDDDLRRTFFSRVRLIFYAAASLAQHVIDELQALASETCGERIVFTTALGATETAPLAIVRTRTSDRAGSIGLPAPGLEAKLVPDHEKLELRVRGPNVTPGYWREPELTAAAFDEEGFYRLGDAVRFLDPDVPDAGLVFDGRVAEDFKLATGTWVNVGTVRARVIAHFTPYLRDAVITGHDRDELGMLVVPDAEACRSLCTGLAPSAPLAGVVRHPAVRATFAALLASFAQSSTGSATRIARLVLLDEAPSLDAQEVTDKGSLNQRAMLTNRAAIVEALYASAPGADVIAIGKG